MNGSTTRTDKGSRLDLGLAQLLVQYGRIESFHPGQVLLRRGDSLTDAYVVLSGQLSISRGRGSRSILETGGILGPFEPGVASPSPVRLRAVTAGKVIRLDVGGIQGLLQRDITMGSRLLFEGRKTLDGLVGDAGPPDTGKVLLAYGPKSGAGTTSAAVLTASRAVGLDLSVLLIDLHSWFGAAALVCDREPEADLADLLVSQITPESLEETVLHQDGGFDLLAAPRNPERGDELDWSHLERLLEVATGAYDLVVMDLASGLNACNLDVFELVQQRYTFELDLYVPASLEGVVAGRQTLDVMEGLGLPLEAVRVVVNRYRATGGVTPGQFRRYLQRPVTVVAEDAGQLLRQANQGKLQHVVDELPEHPLVRATDVNLRRFLGLLSQEPVPTEELYHEELTLLPAPLDGGAPRGWVTAAIHWTLGLFGLRGLLFS